MDSDPLRVRAQSYDLVLNGWELGSGSIRIHRPEIQRRVFEALGISDEESERRFGFLLGALRFGAPPHGGFAVGLDRLVAILAGEDNIREVIAFPKTQSGADLMTGGPLPISARQLREARHPARRAAQPPRDRGSGRQLSKAVPLKRPADLFDAAAESERAQRAPLAERLRPRRLEDVVGQPQLLGERAAFRRLVESDRLSSAILCGPPGSGKTTLARLVADVTAKGFVALSAVSAGVREVREGLAGGPRCGGSGPTASARSSSSTRSTVSARRSRMRCCRASRTAPWC